MKDSQYIKLFVRINESIPNRSPTDRLLVCKPIWEICKSRRNQKTCLKKFSRCLLVCSSEQTYLAASRVHSGTKARFINSYKKLISLFLLSKSSFYLPWCFFTCMTKIKSYHYLVEWHFLFLTFFWILSHCGFLIQQTPL